MTDAKNPFELARKPRTAQGTKKEAKENLPWVEKYRPETMGDIVSHADIITTINNLIEKGRLPHLLFYGPPGTGKTSTILACARKLNGPKFQSMILELNASDERGIDVVRNQIKDFASSKKLFSTGTKLIILDEADQMTQQAQFALRRVIEKYTKTTRFCLICNYVNKIIPALQSRCTRFRFGPLNKRDVEQKLKDIAVKEGVKMDAAGCSAIIELAQGDMRKCLNVLQATTLAYPEVNEENVYLCTGKPRPKDMSEIMDILFNKPMAEASNEIRRIQKEKGLSLADIVTKIHDLVYRIKIPPRVMGFILDELSNLEYRLAFGTQEKLQLGSLVGIFALAKEKIAAARS